MLNGGEEGTGQIPHSSLKAHPNSTTRGKISPLMGNKFTTRGFATCGEFITHSWGYFTTCGGIGDVPFVTHRGFSIHRLGALPLVGELPRPYFFSIRDSTNSKFLILYAGNFFV